MLFNSFQFAIFLPIVFILYWLLNKDLRLQNFFLLIASFYFYGTWDYRFLFLLVFSISLDYFTGIRIFSASERTTKKIWLLISVCINLGFLGVFKYYNFFAGSFENFLSLFGFKADLWTIKVILPVGISFYTFHGLSYVFDLYNGRIKPERNFINYAVFVSFFPLLVAGPIERATHLLPQVRKKREFNYSEAIDGLRQILWGLFKKIVIADNCAEYANSIFNNYSDQSGSTLFLGALFFTFQIYCDFSGYSDIAIGAARLLGIELLKNFSFPYFSRDIAEFWRRWHISLTSWFKDYLYIPLGGSRGGLWLRLRNIFIIFLVSGFWHGANWTFIVWGIINAVYFIPLFLLKKNRTNLDVVAQGRYLPSVKEFLQMSVTFSLVVIAWIFFRSPNLADAINYLSNIFSVSFFDQPVLSEGAIPLLFIITMFMIIEWLGRENHYAIETIGIKLPFPVRWTFYFIVVSALFIYSGHQQQFIYFQF